jgi:hypothetical protein
MRKVMAAALAAAWATGARGLDQASLRDPAAAQAALEARDVAASETGFAVELYRRLAAAASEPNLVVSPFSLHAALALALDGARGATRDGLEGALFGDAYGSKGRNTAILAALRGDLAKRAADGDALRLATRLWVSPASRSRRSFASGTAPTSRRSTSARRARPSARSTTGSRGARTARSRSSSRRTP